MKRLEDFKKLKQLDRIEFMLRRNNLNKLENVRYINWAGLGYVFFGIVGLLILMFIGLMNYGAEESAVEILALTQPITTVFVFLIIFSIIWNIINGRVYKKYHKELEEEFFTTKTKPKQKK